MSLWQHMIDQLAPSKTLQHAENKAANDQHNEQPDSVKTNYRAIEQLVETQQSIQIVSPEGTRHQSMALALDTEDHRLIIDNPMPNLAPWLTNPGQKLRIEHRKGTHLLILTCTVSVEQPNKEDQALALILPEDLNYQPRRQDPRVNIRQDQPLTVKLLSDLGDAWFASVDNISAGGLRVHVGGNISDRLHIGSILPMCHFRIDRELTIQSQVKICAYRFERHPHRHTEISLQFHLLPLEQQHKLSRLVNANQTNEPEVA